MPTTDPAATDATDVTDATAPPAPAFTPRLIGETEKALDAILRFLLDGVVTEPGWVALAVARDAGPVPRETLLDRVVAALRAHRELSDGVLRDLEVAGLLGPDDAAPGAVTLTPEGTAFQTRTLGRTREVTGRLWGDLPVDELAVAASVLATVASRASGELERLRAA